MNFLYKYNTAYVKPCVGSNGRNVYQLKPSRAGKYLCRYRENGKNIKVLLTPEEFHSSFAEKLLADKRLILKQGIDLESLYKKPFDMRVRVQKNGTGAWEIVSNWVRIAAPGSIVTNTSNGGSGDHFYNIFPVFFPIAVPTIKIEIESLVYKACK